MTGAIARPLGFRASATACGLKPTGDDLALVVADALAVAAGVFTTNRAAAPPVLLSRAHLALGRARAVIVNAGCANAATGEAGLEDAREMARVTARDVGCDPNEVVVASTGVIGTRLPMDAIRGGIARAAGSLSRDGGGAAARAILTTDTRAKEVVVEFPLGDTTARVGAMAKGAGMIAPNMATLLAFFTTDVRVSASTLARSLRTAVGTSLNRITVDGDTSTNDMAVALASGVLGPADEGEALDAFQSALSEAARRLALLIIRDGEGATRIAEVKVEGAPHEADADRIARTVAESPLVKTALHGGDPNWGRILAAVGRAEVELDASEVDIHLGEIHVASGGVARDYDEALAHAAMLEDPVRIRISVGRGPGSSFRWTCDFSKEYVSINAHYRS